MVRSEGLRLLAGFLGSASFLAEVTDRLLERQLDKVAGQDHGLSLTHLRILTMVAWGDEETVSDLALFLGVTPAAASKSVDKLVQRGLLRRSLSPEDRRAHLLAPTDVGARLLASWEEEVAHAVQSVFGTFVTPEIQAAEDVIDRVAIAIAEGQDAPSQPCSACALFRREPCGVHTALERRCFFVERKGGAR